jgi:hypothetical protein
METETSSQSRTLVPTRLLFATSQQGKRWSLSPRYVGLQRLEAPVWESECSAGVLCTLQQRAGEPCRSTSRSRSRVAKEGANSASRRQELADSLTEEEESMAQHVHWRDVMVW